MTLIRAIDIAFQYPTQIEPIFHGVNLTLDHGHRIGLIGQNGAGKTTLCAVLTGRLHETTGRIVCKPSLTTGWCYQSLPIGHDTVAEFLGSRGIDIYEGGFMQSLSEWGLSFDRLFDSHEQWSGGELVRLQLATILQNPPDVLILDEPTNHLDREGMDQLVERLASFKGGLIIISHHRDFLDRMTNGTWWLDGGCLTSYGVPISDTLQQREQEQEEQLRLKQELRQQIGQLKESQRARLDQGLEMENFKASRSRKKNGALCKRDEGSGSARVNPGKMMRQSKVLADRIERMEANLAGIQVSNAKSRKIHFEGGEGPQGRRILAWNDHTVVIPGTDTVLLSGLRFDIHGGDRLGLAGPNGCGKTLLLQDMLREMERLGRHVGFLPQVLPSPPGVTVAEYLAGGDMPLLSRSLVVLGSLHVSGDCRNRSLTSLSPGERSKVELTRLIMSEPEVLMLDEPTNHLSMIDLLALEVALSAFAGTLIVVSHDERFLERLGCEIREVVESNA